MPLDQAIAYALDEHDLALNDCIYAAGFKPSTERLEIAWLNEGRCIASSDCFASTRLRRRRVSASWSRISPLPTAAIISAKFGKCSWSMAWIE